MEKRYAMIIDTDKYAGNFERELCTYATGVVGDCGVGSEEAAQYMDAGLPDLSADIRLVADEHGCYRPVKIYPTQGVFNNGFGYHYTTTTEDKAEALKKYKESFENQRMGWIREVEKKIADANFSDARTEERYIDLIKMHKTMMDEALLLEDPPQFPAYQSVAIFFHEKPESEVIEQIKNRSKEYCSKHNINITGFRLETEEITRKTEEI